MTEEEKNQTGAPQEAPEGTPEGSTEEQPPETPQDLIEGADSGEGTVEAGLDSGPAKGPALDQDEGQIQSDTERNRRKERVGLVVSNAPEKTFTVSVEAMVRHPKYKKRVRRSKKFMVHDEGNEARVGDTVRIIETRPISARKRWRLANIVSRAE